MMIINAQTKKVSIASLINASKNELQSNAVSNAIAIAETNIALKNTTQEATDIPVVRKSKLEKLGTLNAENNLAEFKSIQAENAKNENSRLESLARKTGPRTEGFSDLKKIMAMMKVYSPVVAAATLNPGVEGTDNKESTAAVKRMLDETLLLTDEICKMMGVDMNNPDIGWIVSGVKTMAAAQVGNQWTRSFVMGHDDLQSASYLEAYKAVLSMDTPIDVIDGNIRISTSSKLQLSMMKSLMPIVKEINTFQSAMNQPGFLKDYTVDEDAIMTHASGLMVRSVNEFISRLSLPEGDDSRIIFFQGSLNHAGELYARSFAYEVDRKLEAYDSLEPAERLATMKKDIKQNPVGMNLATVEFRFTSTFSTLARLTSEAPVAYAEKLAEKKPRKGRRGSTGDIG